MGDRGIIVEFVSACTRGGLGISECGPVWQLSVIAAFLVIAVTVLVILRVRAVVSARLAVESE